MKTSLSQYLSSNFGLIGWALINYPHMQIDLYTDIE